jgi:hypothetical protein
VALCVAALVVFPLGVGPAADCFVVAGVPAPVVAAHHAVRLRGSCRAVRSIDSWAIVSSTAENSTARKSTLM